MTDVFSEALSDIYDAFQDAGDTGIMDAVFNPAIGDPVSCTVRIYNTDDRQVEGFEGQVTEEITVIEYQLSEIGRDIEDGETFVINGTTYTADGMQGRDSVSRRIAVI